MNHNHDLPPSPDQNEQKPNNDEPHGPSEEPINAEWNDFYETNHTADDTDSMVQEEITDTTNEQITREDAHEIGEKTLEATKQESLPVPEVYMSIHQLSMSIKIEHAVITDLLKTKDFKDCGRRLLNGIYLNNKEQERIALFFKDHINASQLAEQIRTTKVTSNDIGDLLERKDFKGCGLRLRKAIYFNKEEQEKIIAFFEDKKSIQELAEKFEVPRPNITYLLGKQEEGQKQREEGEEEHELFAKTVLNHYATKEGQEIAEAFFDNHTSISKLADELHVPSQDIVSLLRKHEQKQKREEGEEEHEFYLLKLHNYYATKEGQEIAEAFFNNYAGHASTSKISNESHIPYEINHALIRQYSKEVRENNKEVREKINSSPNHYKTTKQLASNLRVNPVDIIKLVENEKEEYKDCVLEEKRVRKGQVKTIAYYFNEKSQHFLKTK